MPQEEDKSPLLICYWTGGSDLSGGRVCSPDGDGAEQRGSGPARGVVSVILKLSWLLLFS